MVDQFIDNSDDVVGNVNLGDQQIFIDNALAAAGYKIATNATPDRQNDEFTSEAEEQKKYRRLTQQFVLATTAQNFQERLSRSTLSDTSLHNGIMQIEGENGEQRNATLEEKNILEDNSKANSMHLTQDEIDMNKFVNGQTDNLPDSLKKIAEEKGLDPAQVSREEYKVMVEDKFPAQAPRINAQGDITAPVTMDSINALREQSSISANPAEMGVNGIKEQFGITAKGITPENLAPTNTGPQIQTPQANFTPNTPGMA